MPGLSRSLTVSFATALMCAALQAQGEIHTFVGGASSDVFGWSVSGAGDVNQDGFDDIAIGARYEDTNGSDAGAVYVHSGADGALLRVFFGDAAKDSLGVSVAAAGDVDGDGYPDLIAGASGVNFGTGLGRVYSGQTGAILHDLPGDTFNDAFGWSVGGAGDVNGDGRADLVVGGLFASPGGFESGRTKVFSGADGTLLFLINGGPGEWEGFAVDGVGDITGDGFTDVLSTAIHAGFPGQVLLGRLQVRSGATGAQVQVVHGTQDTETLGSSACGVGDMNGDGVADYVAGSPLYMPGKMHEAGRMRAFSGVDASTLFVVDGPWLNAHMGVSVAAAGDVNQDGLADVIVGAPHDFSLPFLAGSARVFSGLDGTLVGVLPGDSYVSQFGASVGAIGDIDHDAVPDLLVGAPQGNTAGGASGHVRVMSGACLSIRGYGQASSGSGGFAPTITVAGGLPAIGNSAFGVQVGGCLGGAPAGFLVGAGKTSLRATWGQFLIDPTLPFLVVPFVLGGAPGAPGAGTAALSTPIPNLPALVGVKVFMQVMIKDAGSLGGIAATAGIEVGICR